MKVSKFVVLGVPMHVPEGTPTWAYCVIYEGDSSREATKVYLNEWGKANGNYRSVRLLCNVDIRLEVGKLDDF